MATRLKTIQFAWPMNIATIADVTTYSFPTKTLYIPENSAGSPVTFRSVTVEVGFQDVITSGGGTIDEHRCALRLGAAAFTTFDETDLINSSGEKLSGVVGPIDFTSHFTANFGTGTSQTCDLQVFFSQSTGTTLGMRNVTAVITITYEYNDTATTHIKSAWIPLESLTGALSTTAGTEIGTNQIPQLTGAGGMLPESSIVIRDYYFLIEGNEASTNATDWTINVQIDSGTTTAFGTQETALASCVFSRWIHSLTSTFPSTAAAHQFKMWATGIGRFNHGTITLVVTYEFAPGASTTILNSVYLPLEISSPVGAPDATAASRFQRDFFIEEPGTITLQQSAFRVNFNTPKTVNGMNFRAGSQAYRTYTNLAGVVAGMYCVQQRIDSGGAQGSGVTLARGKNTLTIDLYTTDITDQMTNVNGYAIINYTSSKATAGIGVHSHTTFLSMYAWDAALTDRLVISSYAVSIPETSYYIVTAGFTFYQWMQSASASIGLVVGYLAGEGRGAGYNDIYTDAYQADNERACSIVWMRGRDAFKRFPTDPDTERMDLESARNYRLFTSANSSSGLMSTVTYHSITFTVSGTISGSAGGTVTINTYRSDTHELMNTTTRVGNGTYSFTWYDDTIPLFTEAIEGTVRYGRSTNATAGTALNVVMLAQAVARSYA